MKPPALRVRIIVFYVSRPSGKYQRKFNVKFVSFVAGQQNGAGKSSPLRFLLHGRAGLCLLFLLSLRGVCSVVLSLRGLFGRAFPLTPPCPLAAK